MVFLRKYNNYKIYIETSLVAKSVERKKRNMEASCSLTKKKNYSPTITKTVWCWDKNRNTA